MLVMTMFGSTALAAKKTASASSVATLQTGKWYAAKSDAKIFKLKLNTNSLVNATWKNDSNNQLRISLYRDSQCNSLAASFDCHDLSKGTDILAVKKGTYYLRLLDNSDKSSVKFSVSKLTDKKNYCPARAVAVKQNTKTISGAHTPMNNYDRDWFKVTLTKKQKLTICSDSWFIANNIQVYTSELEGVEMEMYGSLTCKSVKKLPAGTYFINISNDWGYGPYYSRAYYFWWK